ncbi:MAG: bifunctional hydroxymethylpyrimidine kinase/phosphomethylpyrimidine kinase [Eubacterium sp.]
MIKALTIAGSDSSGGAGIQADLKTFAAHGVYGMSVITAITAQNTTGVFNVENISEAMVEAQLDAVFTDIWPDAIKIGMVSSKPIIHAIAKKLKEYKPKNVVLDPVMVATSGDALFDRDAQTTLIEELMPLADIITPNIAEAELLSGISITSKNDMIRAARDIVGYYKGAVLVKGGHLEDKADDLFYDEGFGYWMPKPKINNPNTHGTGCTLSSAIAANLAAGYDMLESVKKAKEYVYGAIEAGLDLGKGQGPLDHLYLMKK